MMDEQYFRASVQGLQRAAARLSQGIPESPLAASWQAILDFVAQSLQPKGDESRECLLIEMGLIGSRIGELDAKVVSDIVRVPWQTASNDGVVAGNLRLLFEQVRALGVIPIPVYEADCNSGVGFYLTARQASLLGRAAIDTESSATVPEKV